MRRLQGWCGLGYTLLGRSVQVYAVLHYVFWVLPKAGWMHYTGRITSKDEGYWRDANKEGKF